MSEGFAAVPNWLVRDGSIPRNVKMLFMILSSHAGRDGVSFPKQEYIAELMGCSVPTVKRTVREMKAMNLVTVTSQRTPTGRRNLYRLMVDSLGGVGSPVIPGEGSPQTQEEETVEQENLPAPPTAQPDALDFQVPEPSDSASPRRSAKPLVEQWVEARRHHTEHVPTREVRRFAGNAQSLCNELKRQHGSLSSVPSSEWQRALDTARHWGFYGRHNLVAAYYGDNGPPALPADHYRIYEDGSVTTWQ